LFIVAAIIILGTSKFFQEFLYSSSNQTTSLWSFHTLKLGKEVNIPAMKNTIRLQRKKTSTNPENSFKARFPVMMVVV
jgi:hypothetical protein